MTDQLKTCSLHSACMDFEDLHLEIEAAAQLVLMMGESSEIEQYMRGALHAVERLLSDMAKRALQLSEDYIEAYRSAGQAIPIAIPSEQLPSEISL